jgi:hypothetical protein
MQLSLTLDQPRARRSDPATSHQAAARASRFSESHAGRIHVALMAGPATAHELAERTGLTVVQIDRRLPGLQRMGMAAVVVRDGVPVTRSGFRVWQASFFELAQPAPEQFIGLPSSPSADVSFCPKAYQTAVGQRP